MATYKGDARQLRDNFPPENANRGDGRGKKRVIYDKISLTASEIAINSIYELGAVDIPKGVRIHECSIKISGSDIADAAKTIEVGYVDPADSSLNDKDAFITTVDANAKGITTMSGDAANEPAGQFLLTTKPLRLAAFAKTELTGATDLVIECTLEFSEE